MIRIRDALIWAVAMTALIGLTGLVSAEPHGAPSTDPRQVVPADTLDFGSRFPGLFDSQEARLHNAGFDDFLPGYDLAVLTRGDVTSRGNICIQGHVHSVNGSVDGSHFTCTPTWTSGFPAPLPVPVAHPDSFAGSTWYEFTATDGPGAADTLYLLDRSSQVLQSWVAPARPASIFWSYLAATGRLTIRFQPPDSFDPISGLLPPLGADSCVVLYTGGRPDRGHATTDVDLSANLPVTLNATLFNARHVGSPESDWMDPASWVGGTLALRAPITLAPRNGLALVSRGISAAGYSVRIGTAERPAASWHLESANFQSGQVRMTGLMVVLGSAELGGGFQATFHGGLVRRLPPHLQPNARAPLIVTGYRIAGPDSMRFRVMTEPDSRPIATEPAILQVLFDDYCAIPQATYEAELIVSSRDADGVLNGGNLPEVRWHLSAHVRGQGEPPEACRPPMVTEARIEGPNPTTGPISIHLDLAQAAHVRMVLFDAVGRRRRTLIENTLDAGRYPIERDWRDEAGRPLPSGMYFVRIDIDEQANTLRLIRVR